MSLTRASWNPIARAGYLWRYAHMNDACRAILFVMCLVGTNVPASSAATADFGTAVEFALLKQDWATANELIGRNIAEDPFATELRLEESLIGHSTSPASLLICFHLARVKLPWARPAPTADLTARFAMLLLAANNRWSLETQVPGANATVDSELTIARELLPAASPFNLNFLSAHGKAKLLQSEQERIDSFRLEDLALTNRPLPRAIAEEEMFLAGVSSDTTGIKRAFLRLLLDSRESQALRINPLLFGEFYAFYHTPLASDFALARVWDWLARANLAFRPPRLRLASRYFRFASSSRGLAFNAPGAEWEKKLVEDVRPECIEETSRLFMATQPESQLVTNRLAGGYQFFNERAQLYLPRIQVANRQVMASIDLKRKCGLRDIAIYASNEGDGMLDSPWREHSRLAASIEILARGDFEGAARQLEGVPADGNYPLSPLVLAIRANLAEKLGRRTDAANFYKQLASQYPNFAFCPEGGCGDSPGTGSEQFLEASERLQRGEVGGLPMIIERLRLRDGA